MKLIPQKFNSSFLKPLNTSLVQEDDLESKEEKSRMEKQCKFVIKVERSDIVSTRILSWASKQRERILPFICSPIPSQFLNSFHKKKAILRLRNKMKFWWYREMRYLGSPFHDGGQKRAGLAPIRNELQHDRQIRPQNHGCDLSLSPSPSPSAPSEGSPRGARRTSPNRSRKGSPPVPKPSATEPTEQEFDAPKGRLQGTEGQTGRRCRSRERETAVDRRRTVKN